jgi:NAD(P)-dependent dehydrogenase (short-subunit alcohol dehydrogenase family)
MEFLPIVCDVTKEAEVLALPRIIAKRWAGSGIDILVNNAAVGRPDGSLVTGSTAAWVEMVSTNILGLSLCTREAVQDMSRRRVAQGHVINIGQLDTAVSNTQVGSFALPFPRIANLDTAIIIFTITTINSSKGNVFLDIINIITTAHNHPSSELSSAPSSLLLSRNQIATVINHP